MPLPVYVTCSCRSGFDEDGGVCIECGGTAEVQVCARCEEGEPHGNDTWCAGCLDLYVDDDEPRIAALEG